MKTIIGLMATLLMLALPAQSQTSVKLYGYYQPASPGIQKAKDLYENGQSKPVKEAENRGNYMIYAVSTAAARVYPVELWISGKRYGVKMKPIKQTPVTHINPSAPDNSNAVVLVPKSSGTVLQLTPTDAVAQKQYPKAETLAATNELVFVFKQGGTFYYEPLPKLVSLNAVSLQ